MNRCSEYYTDKCLNSGNYYCENQCVRRNGDIPKKEKSQNKNKTNNNVLLIIAGIIGMVILTSNLQPESKTVMAQPTIISPTGHLEPELEILRPHLDKLYYDGDKIKLKKD
jgi:hypothetical protein